MRGWLLTVAVAATVSAVAAAQERPCDGWREPLVTRLVVRVARRGERSERLRRPRIELARGEAVTLEVEGRDQWGDPFPEERAAFGLDLGRRCRGLVAVRQNGTARFRLRALDETGSCRVVVWAAGNLNLDRELEVRVVPVARAGYDRAEAEYIARRLYRALLDREPDPTGFAAAVAEIQRGRLESQVRGMVASREFTEKRRGTTHSELLERIYRGLLGRDPDSEGVRHFMPMLARGKVADVVLGVIRSDEFESRMLRETSRLRPGTARHP